MTLLDREAGSEVFIWGAQLKIREIRKGWCWELPAESAIE